MSVGFQDSMAAVRELASQIFAETDCAECPTPEVRGMRAMVPVLPKLNGQRWGERPRVPRRGLLPLPKARAGEVRLHVFLEAEKIMCGVSKMVVYGRLVSGKYPGVTVRRARPGFTFVSGALSEPNLTMVNAPQTGEVSLKHFVATEAQRNGATESAIYMRLNRGAYPDLAFRRVNQRVVFVKVPAARATILTTDTHG